MRILGAHLSPELPSGVDAPGTLVALDDDGRVVAVRSPASLPAAAIEVGALVAGEPFLLAVNIPVVVPARAARTRPFESLVRRKLGFRVPAGGRASLAPGRGGVAGEALLAALAAAGLPCVPFPDRDRRVSGLAEVLPGLALKVLLWERSAAARGAAPSERAERFRTYAPPELRQATGRARGSWAERAAALDLVARVLASDGGVDVRPVADALGAASDDAGVERAASVLDACVAAATGRRYLESPETCVFLGDRESGYTILPADGFVRSLVLGEPAAARARLFPAGSLRERLGSVAELHATDLLAIPGRPQRTEAVLREPPLYEFDNLDEMLWWKHCRHVSGPSLPVEGLCEIVVALGREGAEEGRGAALRLVRSRHRTLSFRFDPPSAWRARVPTRDGRTYPFRILRAVYETLPAR